MARFRLRLRITPRLRLRQDKIIARPRRRERGEREVRGRRERLSIKAGLSSYICKLVYSMMELETGDGDILSRRFHPFC